MKNKKDIINFYDMNYDALLFIGDPNFMPGFQYNHMINENRFFMRFKDLENFNTQKPSLAQYNKVLIVILIETVHPPVDYSFHRHSPGTLEYLMDEIFSMAQGKNYTILSLSCWGLYMHQFALLLPRNTTLITVSDYIQSTHRPQMFYSYLNRPKNLINLKAMFKYYLADLNTEIPQIYMSSNIEGRIVFTNLFLYTNYHYNANPFFNCKSEKEVDLLYDKHYIPGENPSFHTERKWEKVIQPERNPENYVNPYTVVEEINQLLSSGESLKPYLHSLYREHYKSYEELTYFHRNSFSKARATLALLEIFNNNSA